MRALLFGSFNPVTNAHVAMGVAARKALGRDCIVTYIPAKDDYITNWKGYRAENIFPAKIRLGLMRDAVSPYGFEVSSVEIDGITNGLTYNTMNYFGFENSVLCIGSDNLKNMKKWYRWDDLLAKASLLVFRRGTGPDGSEVILRHIAHNYEIMDLPESCLGMSSTLVRNCYRAGDMEMLRALVPENVFQYMKEENHVCF